MDGANRIIAYIGGEGDLRPQLITSQTITIVAALLAILLRFFSRYVSKASFGLDDWLMIPSISLALACYGLYWWMISNGLGRYEGEVTFAKLRVPNLSLWIAQLFYPIAMSMINFSVLALYARVFRRKDARIYCAVVGVLRFAWMVVVVVLVCLECRPLQSVWDFELRNGDCPIDRKNLFLGNGIGNIVLDVATIALAILLCARLHLPSFERVLLCGVFASGFLVTIVTGIRIKAIQDLDLSMQGQLNSNWTFSNACIWMFVEVNIAIVSACLPCMRPLLKKVGQYFSTTSMRKKSPAIDTTTASTIPSPTLRRTSRPGIGGVPGGWFRISRMSQLGPNDVEFGDPKKPQSVRTRHGASELDLPIQDLEGDEIPRMPAQAHLERPPSWAASLPLWDGSSGRTQTHVEAGRLMSEVPEGIMVRHSINIESARESPWPLKD